MQEAALKGEENLDIQILVTLYLVRASNTCSIGREARREGRVTRWWCPWPGWWTPYSIALQG